MFSKVVYWLGAQGCSALGAFGHNCGDNEQWNVGIILLVAGALVVSFLVFRSRS